MPTREVDEAEWAAQQSVTKLFADMLNNPEARTAVLKAKKTVRPNEPIPEIDAAAQGFAAIENLSKEFKDFRTQLQKDKDEAEAKAKAAEFSSAWEKSKRTLKEEGWLDDGVAAIEKLAQDRGIPDLEAAAALYSKLHPQPEPVQPSGYGRFNMFEVPADEKDSNYVKKLLETRGDADNVLDPEIRAAINDVRGTVARR